MRTIGKRFGNRPISEVRSGEIEEWLAESDWSKRTRNNYVSTLSTLFIFASDRDYCLGNPAEKIPRAILDDSAPGILTVEQVAKLLKVTREEDPGMLAYVAIGLFAGLRRSELCALEWSEIDVKARTIEVKGAKEPSAPYRDHFRALKNLCSERLDEHGSLIRKAIVYSWPHNALRHSFGSYYYAQYRDENRTAAEMGNSPAVVFRHYRALVKREAADAFWTFRPV